MSNEIVVKDKFVDFKGVEHQFIIAAVKEPIGTAAASDYDLDGEDYIIGDVRSCLRIGVSICNPADKFDEKLGVLQAVGRAYKSEPSLYAEFSGQLGEDLIKAFIAQEIKYLNDHPEKDIGGYLDAKKHYEEEQEMNKLEGNFTDIEKVVVEGVKKNPEYLDNVQKYLMYWKKCRK